MYRWGTGSVGRQPRLRVGLLGCGVIGSHLARFITRHLADRLQLIGLADVNCAAVERLAGRLAPPVPPYLSLPELIQRSDLIVEAASAAVVPPLVRRATAAGKALFIMSAGGLLTSPSLLQLCLRRHCRLFLPSGALLGIDGVKAARFGRIRRITLTTRKPPASLAGAPGIVHRGLDPRRLRRPTLLFEGSPSAAVSAFPQNINVCATVALAAGRCPMTVRIIAVPGLRRNVHELEVIGDMGRLRTRAENVPDDANPRTSRLALLSATACLQSLVEYVRIGT